jgi:hypothetical protein
MIPTTNPSLESSRAFFGHRLVAQLWTRLSRTAVFDQQLHELLLYRIIFPDGDELLHVASVPETPETLTCKIKGELLLYKVLDYIPNVMRCFTSRRFSIVIYQLVSFTPNSYFPYLPSTRQLLYCTSQHL